MAFHGLTEHVTENVAWEVGRVLRRPRDGDRTQGEGGPIGQVPNARLVYRTALVRR